jgi:hypothetical protein
MTDFHGLTDLYISEFRKFDIPASDPDIVALIHSPVGLMMIMFTLKPWMCCTFGKEVFETMVQVTKGLLQGNGIYFFQEGIVLLPLLPGNRYRLLLKIFLLVP